MRTAGEAAVTTFLRVDRADGTVQYMRVSDPSPGAPPGTPGECVPISREEYLEGGGVE